MMSQNVSPGAWCVIIAIVIWGVLALPAPLEAEVSVACLPPNNEQAASPVVATASTAARPRTRGFLNMRTPRRHGDCAGRGDGGPARTPADLSSVSSVRRSHGT